jgi:hypothetical protein
MLLRSARPGRISSALASTYVHPSPSGFARRLPLGFVGLLLSGVLTLPIATFGLAQLAATTFRQLNGPAETVDFVAFYAAGRLVLDQPGSLYDSAAWEKLQSVMHAGPALVLQFWNPPHTALLMAPLAMLPFGVAYLVWLVVNLTCLGGACYLLAPRPTRAATWLGWLVVLPLFLPVQLGLIMGQLSFALLFGFAVFVRLADWRGPWRQAAALLAWTTKPQLMPVLLLSLVCMRRWRTLALLCGLPVVLSLPVLLVGGGSVVLDYVKLAGGAGSGVLTAEAVDLGSGHSILGLAQWLLGPGWTATALAALGSVGVCLLVGSMWRTGVHADARRFLQLALLPVAAFVISPHVLAYDAVTWLASAWLVLTFAAERPHARRVVVILLFTGWWGGNLAAIPEVRDIAPWGALGAIVSLAGMAWLYRQTPPPLPNAIQG